MRPVSSALIFPVFALALLALSGCAGSKSVAQADPQKTCQENYEKASRLWHKGKDVEAEEKLRDLTIQCAGYDFVEEAQYLLAESYFRTEQWMEAQTEYGILIGNFDRTPHLEEANWKLCLSAFHQAPSWDRDPALTTAAIDRLESFASDFPATSHLDSVKIVRDQLLERLAHRRFETGALYLRMDEPLAATQYFQLLLQEYPDWPRIPEARLKLSEAYARLDQFDRARETLDTLRADPAVAAKLQREIHRGEERIAKEEKRFEARRKREEEDAARASRAL